MILTLINNDDEVTLSARERGHTYAATDVILGSFRVGDLPPIEYVVRYVEEHGGGGYVDETGYVLQSDVELVAWRYATKEEVERFETGPQAQAEEESIQS